MSGRFIESAEPLSLSRTQADHAAHVDGHWHELHRPKRTIGRLPGESNADAIGRLAGELAAAEHDRDRYRRVLDGLPTAEASAALAGGGQAGEAAELVARWVLDADRRLRGRGRSACSPRGPIAPQESAGGVS